LSAYVARFIVTAVGFGRRGKNFTAEAIEYSSNI
jgi:hypothetical protein